MDTLARFNDAMRYIETGLTEEIDYGEMARRAGCSEYHFRRVFSFLAGMPLGEYIRRRRLAMAAERIRLGDDRVIDLALMFGYESADAFSKAFAAMHGSTPSQAKKGQMPVVAFPPMTFQLTMRGGTEMNYHVTKKEQFRIVGFKKRITMQFEGVNQQIEPIVQKLTPEAIAGLKSLCDTEPYGMLSVSANFAERTEEGRELDQYIGVATTQAPPEGFDMLDVDASDWAVFTVTGAFPAAMQSTWAKIYAEWLPSSGYDLAEGPEMLWHESPDLSSPMLKSEIWIPVKRKEV